LGSGWLFGLLDARFVQRSQDAFDMISIDGYTVPFGRDPKKPTILNGAQGYKAEIKGDTIDIWASCGWKLRFVKGKIAALSTPKNLTIQIRRDQDGVVTDVVEGTNVLLKLERGSDGRVSGLALADGRKIGIEQVEKPLIHSIEGINVIGSVGPAVSKVTRADGTTTTFGYTPNDKIQPTLSIAAGDAAPRTITWDPASRTILSDGIWKYKITQAEIAGHNAAIERVNEQGQREFWHYDSAKGQETTDKADGSKQIRKWFTSGKFAGRVRGVAYYNNKTEAFSQRNSYDEFGRLIRIVQNNGEEVYKAVIVGDELLSETYDGRTSEFKYTDNKKIILTTMPSGRVITREIDSEGDLLHLTVKDTKESH
jgi:hypothetical protein